MEHRAFIDGLNRALDSAGLPTGIRERIRVHIAGPVPLPSSPRDSQGQGAGVLHAMLLVAVATTESLYGEGSGRFEPLPRFDDATLMSQVRMNAHQEGVIVIGNCAQTWEEVFYDMCHEAVHLLDPVVDVSRTEVSYLEEGCAVKFAEQMHAAYVRPYCDLVPRTSPMGDRTSPYHAAYAAASKMPDDVLKQARRAFGSFAKVNDANRLGTIAGSFLSNADLELLASAFPYPSAFPDSRSAAKQERLAMTGLSPRNGSQAAGAAETISFARARPDGHRPT